MKRITKYEPSKDSMFPYKLVDNELSTELDCVHKLGLIEDIMEKHNINDYRMLGFLLKEYERISKQEVELYADLGMFQNENINLTKDIEKYWNLEEELGCSLEVVFKKVKELTIENWNQVHCLQYDYDEKLWYIISYSLWDDEFYQDRQYYLKDYQKTWWLKGEENGK